MKIMLKVQREKFSVAGERMGQVAGCEERETILCFFPGESPFNVEILELLRTITRSLLEKQLL